MSILFLLALCFLFTYPSLWGDSGANDDSATNYQAVHLPVLEQVPSLSLEPASLLDEIKLDLHLTCQASRTALKKISVEMVKAGVADAAKQRKKGIADEVLLRSATALSQKTSFSQQVSLVSSQAIVGGFRWLIGLDPSRLWKSESHINFIHQPLWWFISEQALSLAAGKNILPNNESKETQEAPSTSALILKRLVLVNSPDQVGHPSSQDDDMPVMVDGFSAPSQSSLVKMLKKFIGKPLTIPLLDAIRSKITDFYHDHGYPLVGVSAPAGQTISNGQVVILVLVGKLNKVNAYGARWFSNSKTAKEISIEPGEEIRTGPLLDDVSWLNQDPFRSVELVYNKGPTLGETDITLVTKDRFPLRVFGGYSNTGNVIAGDSRWFTGFNAGNLWGADHQMNFQFVSATPLREWWGIDGNYIAPLPCRHIWRFMGSYIKTKPTGLKDLQGNAPSSQVGKNIKAATRYQVILPALSSYQHSFEIGYEYKRENNFLSVSPSLIFRNALEISQFTLGYNATWEGMSGTTLFNVVAFLSPGKMTPKNKNRYFEAERPGCHANYAYFRAALDRTQMLPKKFSWVFSSFFQWTGSKLEPSEELSLGGFASIRGYDENEIVSDRGVMIKNELRSPSISFMKKKDDSLQFLVFVDFGIANNVDEQIYDRNNVALASVGPGIRYNIPEYVTFYLDWGLQLHYIHNRPFVDNQRGRIHTGLTVGF